MPRPRRGRGSNVIQFPDLSKVDSGSLIPEGDYLFEVKKIEEGKGDAGPYLAWTFFVAEGQFKGNTPKAYNTSFADRALWKLKQLLDALQVDIPDEPFELDHDELVGKQMMGSVVHDTYEGRKYTQITDFWPASDVKEEDEEEKKPARSFSKDNGKKKTKAADPTPISQDEVNEMDQDELEALVDEYELDVDLSSHRTMTKMRAAVIDALEKAELLAQEDEPEPPPPTKEKETGRRARR